MWHYYFIIRFYKNQVYCKNTSFEDGKMGVEVITDSNKTTYSAANISSAASGSDINVYFSELVDYYAFAKDGLMYDISDVVTAKVPAGSTAEDTATEAMTIEDKLSNSMKEYYTSFDGNYYALPHYKTYRGIIYDKDLFNMKKLYIKADGTINGQETDSDLSNGPDGKPNTSDDGLPATFDEFFAWCDFIKNSKNVTPICWTGQYINEYLKHLTQAVYADAQGTEQGNLYYNVDDTEQDLDIIDGFDNNGKPIVKTIKISQANPGDRVKAKGWYYASEFVSRLIQGNYYYAPSMYTTQDHHYTHYDFLHSRFDTADYDQPIAMMVEGTWWEEESDLIFETMENNYINAGRKDRNFGFLPLPKYDESELGEQTYYDQNMSIVFVNANCTPVQAAVAKKFIQYISMESNLQKFNTITGIGRDYKYELTDEQFNSLSAVGKEIYEGTKSQNIVYGFTTKYNYSKKQMGWEQQSIIAGKYFQYPVDAFRSGYTAKEFFLGCIEANKNV